MHVATCHVCSKVEADKQPEIILCDSCLLCDIECHWSRRHDHSYLELCFSLHLYKYFSFELLVQATLRVIGKTRKSLAHELALVSTLVRSHSTIIYLCSVAHSHLPSFLDKLFPSSTMIISTRALAALSLIFASAVVPATSHRSRRHDELFSKSPKSTEASKSKESNKSSKSNKVSSEPSTNPSTDPSITPSSEPSVAPNDVDTAKPTYSNRFFRKLTMGHEDGVQRIVELPLDTVDSIFEKRDFEVDQKPIFHEKTAVLTKAQCDALMNYIDKVDSFGYEVDSRSFPLSAEDLIKLVGNGALREIVNFYGKSFGPKPIVREILLHRFVNHEAECSEGSCQSTYFDWHTDSEVSSYRQGTIVIPLNEDSELIGGDLYYLGRDGGPIRSSRTQGKATAHADKTLHAIAPFEGTRDTLILHFDVDPDITDPHPGMPYNSWRADLL